MKKIYQLKTLLDVVLWITIIILILSIFMAVFAIISGNPDEMNFKMNGEIVTTVTQQMIPLMVLTLLGYASFVGALYQLKQLVSLFVKRRFFTDKSILILKQIGSLLFCSCILIYVPGYLFDVFFNESVKISFGTVSPESFFFLLIIALFFFTLSHIFDEARKLQEETELTV